MKKYIIEKADGKWNVITSTPFKEALGLVPRVRKGFITVDGMSYAVDPKRFRRLPYRPKRFLKLVTEEAQVQLWKENDPEPIDLFLASENNSENRTAALIAQAMNQTWIEKALSRRGMDWTTMLLLMSIVANIALAGAVWVIGRS